MNMLTFVFSIILILSFATLAIHEKQIGARRIKTTFLGHIHAERKILSACEREAYNSFKSIPKPKKANSNNRSTTPHDNLPAKPNPNSLCARINLQPLIDQGKETHPFLYSISAKMLKLFYEPLFTAKGAQSEYRFLDAWLNAARNLRGKQEENFSYEKIVFKDPAFQSLYYKMLKGTKTWNLREKRGYPSLLDYVQFDPKPTKICLAHSHPDLLSVLFNQRAADKLYAEVHKPKPPVVTKELIERICFETQMIYLDPELYGLLHLGAPSHKAKSGFALVAEDAETHITLKKNVHQSQL